MTSRSIHPLLPASLCTVILALAGCADAYTIHPIAVEPAAPVAPTDLQGLWVEDVSTRDAGDRVYAVLRIAPPSLGGRTCDVAELRLWKEPTVLAADPLLEGRVCLAEVAGHMIAEVTTPTGPGLSQHPVLYQHYLVRLGAERISVCALGTVWGVLKEAAGAREGFDFEGLQYTQRDAGEFDQVFLISPPEALRSYLEKNVARAAATCDELEDEPGWTVFERVTPKPARDAGQAARGDRAG